MEAFDKLPGEINHLVSSFSSIPVVGDLMSGVTQYSFWLIVSSIVLLIIMFAFARRKASEIVLEARSDAEKERSRIVALAHNDAEDIIAKARDRADDEMKRAYAGATDTIAKMSVAVAGKIVGDTLANDEAKQRELIKKYLAEVGGLNG